MTSAALKSSPHLHHYHRRLARLAGAGLLFTLILGILLVSHVPVRVQSQAAILNSGDAKFNQPDPKVVPADQILSASSVPSATDVPAPTTGAPTEATASAATAPTLPSANASASNIVARGTRRTDAGSYITFVLLVFVGLAYCFYGFSLFFPTLFITGFYLVSNIVMLSLVRSRPFTVGTPDPATGNDGGTRFAYFGIAAGCGVLGGMLLTCFWSVGVYVVGFLAGLSLAQIVLATLLVKAFAIQIIILVLCGTVAVILVHYFERPVIICGTALGGAYSIVLGIDILANWGFTYDGQFPDVQPGRESIIEAGIVLALAVVGAVWQWRKFQGPFGGERRARVVVVEKQVPVLAVNQGYGGKQHMGP